MHLYGTGDHCEPLAHVCNSTAECWDTMLLRPVGLLPPANSSTGVPGETGNPSDLVRHRRGELNTVILVSRLGVSNCNCVLLLLLCSDLESMMWGCYSSSKSVHFTESALLKPMTNLGGCLSSTLHQGMETLLTGAALIQREVCRLKHRDILVNVWGTFCAGIC